MVLQFGQVKCDQGGAGARLQDPVHPERRLLRRRIQGLDTNALEVTPLDDRRLIVDAFARWRIPDVQQFRRAVGVGGMQAAEQRLEAILNANVREALGSVRSEAVLSADRVGLMNRIRDQSIERGARARRRDHRRAAEARRPARAEPDGDLRADEGRARARGRRRAGARPGGGAAAAGAGRPDGDRDRLRGRSRRADHPRRGRRRAQRHPRRGLWRRRGVLRLPALDGRLQGRR